MGDPLLGRYAAVKLGTTTVNNFGRWSLNISMAEISVDAFGSVWGKSMPGLQKWTGTMEGMYDPADTSGQWLIQNSALAATKITDIRFYINSTSYWAPKTDNTNNGAYINTVSIDHDMNGVARVTFNVLGYGELALV